MIGATAHYVPPTWTKALIIAQDVEQISRQPIFPKRSFARAAISSGGVLARAVRHHLADRVLLNGEKTVVFTDRAGGDDYRWWARRSLRRSSLKPPPASSEMADAGGNPPRAGRVLESEDPASIVQVGHEVGADPQGRVSFCSNTGSSTETSEAELLARIAQPQRRSAGPRHSRPAPAAAAYSCEPRSRCDRTAERCRWLPPGECRPAFDRYRRACTLHAAWVHAAPLILQIEDLGD